VTFGSDCRIPVAIEAALSLAVVPRAAGYDVLAQQPGVLLGAVAVARNGHVAVAVAVLPVY
jgi:hypothetical protein